MKVITSGIVTNQYGHVLLIQRDDSLTWAAPGGLLEHGELPTEGVAREVREETGLIVMPVRLVALDFVPGQPDPLLCLTFRCIQRGGQIATSAESLRVGWIQGNQLPASMLSYHRQRVEQALTHTDNAPVWGIEQGAISNRIFNRLKLILATVGRDKEQIEPPFNHTPSPDWEIETAVLIQNSKNETLWVKSGKQWVLPGARSNGKQPPWQTAVQATKKQIGQIPTLITLAGVYTNENKLTFLFLGKIPKTALAQVDNVKYSSETPENANSTQAGWLNTAVTAEDVTIFREEQAMNEQAK